MTSDGAAPWLDAPVPAFRAEPPDEPAHLAEILDRHPLAELEDPDGAEPPADVPASLEDLAYAAWHEARSIGGAEWDNATDEVRAAKIAGRILYTAGAAESLARAGYTGPDALARYLADAMAVSAPGEAPTGPFLEPEDRGAAVLSALGDVEYVEDLIRPGRIVVWAAEEGAGKSYTADGELGIRVAVAGGALAGTWPILRHGPVLVLSEMHADDDYAREASILEALELERSALTSCYYRLPLMTAAGGPPVLTVAAWRDWLTGWLRDRSALLLIVDTATGATQVDPWGQAIQAVYRDLRAMLEAYPELAIVLVLHLKKPQGRGDRRISDVLGEWGRWCDVIVLQEADGTTRTKLATYKRVRHQRRIVATRAAGLLVDPIDLDTAAGTKMSRPPRFSRLSRHVRTGSRTSSSAPRWGYPRTPRRAT